MGCHKFRITCHKSATTARPALQSTARALPLALARACSARPAAGHAWSAAGARAAAAWPGRVQSEACTWELPCLVCLRCEQGWSAVVAQPPWPICSKYLAHDAGCRDAGCHGAGCRDAGRHPAAAPAGATSSTARSSPRTRACPTPTAWCRRTTRAPPRSTCCAALPPVRPGAPPGVPPAASRPAHVGPGAAASPGSPVRLHRAPGPRLRTLPLRGDRPLLQARQRQQAPCGRPSSAPACRRAPPRLAAAADLRARRAQAGTPA